MQDVKVDPSSKDKIRQIRTLNVQLNSPYLVVMTYEDDIQGAAPAARPQTPVPTGKHGVRYKPGHLEAIAKAKGVSGLDFVRKKRAAALSIRTDKSADKLKTIVKPVRAFGVKPGSNPWITVYQQYLVEDENNLVRIDGTLVTITERKCGTKVFSALVPDYAPLKPTEGRS